jgi:energy-coupling factor transporter ATP-binding protein EcfA2
MSDLRQRADLILVRGMPGSGKSTLAKILRDALDKEGMPAVYHYEADMYFLDEQGNYNFEVTELGAAHGWCLRKTREGLMKGTVIVSNTFTAQRELRPYFNLAKEFGVVPVVYLAQNQFLNVHNVPANKLQAMRDRFEYDISWLFEEYFND